MAMGTRILKTLLLPLRALQLLLSLFIVGVASFHVYQFSRNHLHVNGGSDGQLPNALYAIEVISCVAALYALLTLLATCFGHRLFFLFTLFTDLLLTGGFIAIAILLRGSRHSNSCSTVESWSPSVPKSTNNLPASLYLTTTTTTTTTADTRAPPRLLCNLDKACFALAIALAVLLPAAMALSLLALPGSGGHHNHNRRGSVTQKPFARASEETAYTNNSTTAAPYEAPGFRGGADGMGGAPPVREYRAPAPYDGASELETARNGRFDPVVGGVQGGYVGRGQNF